MLHLPKADYDEILRHGEETYPHECCGILLGQREAGVGRVLTTVRCGNMRRDSPRTRYEIDPRELIRVQREARARQLEIVGFYHSHPGHPPMWSSTDLDEAHWIGYSYVILAVERGEAREVKSFVLGGTREEDKVFTEEEVIFQ